MTDFFNTLSFAYKDWIKPDTLNVNELIEGTRKFDDFTLTAVKTAHIESSLAYRIESNGKSIVYSGDTDYSESFVELSADADVLLIECAFADDNTKIEGHLSPSEVTTIVNKSKAKRVITTHFYPDCDQEQVVERIRSNVDVEVIEAQDFLEIVI